MTLNPPEAKQNYHHGDLKRALLDSAMTLIAEIGTTKLTLREIARRAGVSHAAPYRHFQNKTDLIGSVAAQAFRALSEYLDERLAPFENPLTRFEALCLAYVKFAAEYPDRFQMMFGADLPPKSKHPELQSASDGSYQRLVRVVSECQEQGLLREGDSEALALTGWSMSHGLAVLIVEGQLEISSDEELEAIVRASASNLYIGLRPLIG